MMKHTSNMKALIIGIDSVVGSALCNILEESDWIVYGTTRRKVQLKSGKIFYLDLAKVEDFSFDHKIEAVFLCACVTNIAQCRNNKKAQKINVDAQIQLARYLLDSSQLIIYLSSSAVFDGKMPKRKLTDKTCPITNYGRYKEAVEQQLLQISKNIAIVRLTKILYPKHPLIRKWIKILSEDGIIEPFYDLKLCPVSLELVAQSLKKVAEKKITGIVHLSGEKDFTYLDIAKLLISKLHLPERHLNPKSALEYGVLPSEMPQYTSLAMDESEKFLSIKNTDIDTMLDELLKKIL